MDTSGLSYDSLRTKVGQNLSPRAPIREREPKQVNSRAVKDFFAGERVGGGRNRKKTQKRDQKVRTTSVGVAVV